MARNMRLWSAAAGLAAIGSVVGLSAGCAAPPSVSSAASPGSSGPSFGHVMTPTPIAGAEELSAEPTTKYTPPVTSANLFDLLSVMADYEPSGTLAQQVQNHRPTGAIRGAIVAVRIGSPAQEPASASGAVVAGTAILRVKPSALGGKVKVGADGLVEVEVYRPSGVTQAWLDKATGYEGLDCIFLVRGSQDPAVGRYPVAGIEGVYGTDPQGTFRSLLAGPGHLGPRDMHGLGPAKAWSLLTTSAPALTAGSAY